MTTHRERLGTNEGLRAERAKTDEELIRRKSDAEAISDGQVSRSRELADAAVAHARAQVDQGGVQPVVDSARLGLDAMALREREEADARVLSERGEGARELAKLLSLERGFTDQRLTLERDRADFEVSSRDAFLAMVAHDLRDLLGALAIGAAMLARLPAGDQVDRVHREAHRMQRHIARMTRLVGDLQDLGSIESGRLGVSTAPHSLLAVVQESVQAFAPLAASRGITLVGDVQPPSLVADFDHDRILQVLANLLSNAIKFMPEGGGQVTVDVDGSGAEVRFRVSDTGPGLASEHAELVFERFWQASSGDRRGLGIGLFITRSIVEAHGGRIWAEPRPQGGTVFTFTLPVRRG